MGLKHVFSGGQVFFRWRIHGPREVPALRLIGFSGVPAQDQD
jgi:hypothetical protein